MKQLLFFVCGLIVANPPALAVTMQLKIPRSQVSLGNAPLLLTKFHFVLIFLGHFLVKKSNSDAVAFSPIPSLRCNDLRMYSGGKKRPQLNGCDLGHLTLTYPGHPLGRKG
jgi:hypothetical protein